MKLEKVLEIFPDPRSLTTEQATDHYARIQVLLRSIDMLPRTRASAEEVCAVAAMHPDPWVRYAVLNTFSEWFLVAPDQVTDAIRWLTHDSEDFVAFQAIRTAGSLRLTQAMPDLLLIVGPASERLRWKAGKPVGMGHAVVLRAIVDIAGTHDPDEIAKLESQWLSGGRSGVLSYAASEADVKLLKPAPRQHDHSGMVFIPSGQVKFHKPKGAFEFDWADVEDGWVEDVKSFWIDRYPVTAGEYDRFAESYAAKTHVFCHPSEPPGKLHIRNTLFDGRFGPDHPVTGIDWFDAYAYARWRGKRLPTEAEWQRAAMGDGERMFPWGNTFDSSRVRWIGEALGRVPQGIAEWRKELVLISCYEPFEASPRNMTVAVDALESNMSPYGVVGMSGNAWEWTCSSFFYRHRLRPNVGERDILEVTQDRESYAVIRGGSVNGHLRNRTFGHENPAVVAR